MKTIEQKKHLAEYARKYRKIHKEQLSDWNKRRYQKDRIKNAERSKIWRKLNPEKTKATQARRYIKYREELKRKSKEYAKNHPEGVINRRLLYKFGITLEEYNKILQTQGNGCAICGKNAENDYQRLGVDHCHKTGKNRGILCSHCNSGIGYLQDNIEILKNSIKYLKKYE